MTRREVPWLLAALLLVGLAAWIQLAWFPGLREPPYRPAAAWSPTPTTTGCRLSRSNRRNPGI